MGYHGEHHERIKCGVCGKFIPMKVFCDLDAWVDMKFPSVSYHKKCKRNKKNDWKP